MSAVQKMLAAWRAKHARRAWRPPVCVDGEDGGAQFGGAPLLAHGEPWPSCASCQQPMQFFLQLPSASLPDGYVARGEGTLQLFYCSQDNGSCEAWRPFSGAHLVRLLRLPSSTATDGARQERSLGGWPFWVQGMEYPRCPRCGRTMHLVLQVDSANNVPHVFGNFGCGHVMQCRDHPDVLTFAWGPA